MLTSELFLGSRKKKMFTPKCLVRNFQIAYPTKKKMYIERLLEETGQYRYELSFFI